MPYIPPPKTVEPEKTTDRLFEFPFYNRKGQLHRQNVSQVVLLLYGTTAFALFNLEAALYHFTVAPTLIFEHYGVFLQEVGHYMARRFRDVQSYGLEMLTPADWGILASTLSIPFIPVYFFLRRVFAKARIQANLASVGLEHYYLYRAERKNKIFFFKLLKGHRMGYETFIHQFDNLKQLFEEGDIEYQRYKSNMVRVRFKEPLIDIETVKHSTRKPSLQNVLASDKLVLGITSKSGDIVYAPQKEEGRGLLNGHWLVVGASGAGKSVSMKSLCLNFLHPENYRFIDNIFIINYKKSSDYNFLKPLNKVHYAEDIKDSLKLLKQIQLNMFNKYLYNSKNSLDNFTAYQSIVIIDEIQTLTELLDSKGLHKVERNSIQECLSIIEQLGSKARASNISLMVILQKADIASLPSSAFRQNLRNRLMMKQETNVSASLVINSEILERENIRPLELTQGQFIYLDTLRNELKRGLTIYPDVSVDVDRLNGLRFDKETQAVYDEVVKNRDSALKTIQTQKEELEHLANSGKKTFYDSFDDIEDMALSSNDDLLDEVDALLKNKG